MDRAAQLCACASISGVLCHGRSGRRALHRQESEGMPPNLVGCPAVLKTSAPTHLQHRQAPLREGSPPIYRHCSLKVVYVMSSWKRHPNLRRCLGSLTPSLCICARADLGRSCNRSTGWNVRRSQRSSSRQRETSRHVAVDAGY